MASSSTKPIPPTDADDDIDVETIQSTVDISLSLALNLVQSWMPPNTSTSVDPAILESRKKLEEHMRRPPRLGVGAPIPTAQTQAGGASSHHETQRLKNRLVGAGAARRMAEEGKVNGVERSGAKRRPGSESDEDESESRASAMKKGRTTPAKPNGLSVFGSTTKPKPATQPNVQTEAPVNKSPSPALPSAPTIDPTPKTDDPKPTPPDEPEEPMGIHTLPSKLPLAAKIWPRMSHSASSPIGSDRSQTKRRKVAPMLPPPSPAPLTPNTPELAWSSLLPQLPPSRSGSNASVTSSVSSRNVSSDKPGGEHIHQPGADSTAHLSRKEQKRLRKAAQKSIQRASEPDEPASEEGEPKLQSSDNSAAQPKTGALRNDEPVENDLESGDESEGVSRIRENQEVSEDREKAGDKNDTVQGGAKKKRKRKAEQKLGPS